MNNSTASTLTENYHLEKLIKRFKTDDTFFYFTKMIAEIFSKSTYSLRLNVGTRDLEFIYPDETLRNVENVKKLQDEYTQIHYSELFQNNVFSK
jgi:hypothetical protein